MAKATISLSDLMTKYRGSGVWTLISDESIQTSSPTGETVRLVAGFSKVGWFNRPFYIEKGDLTTAKLLFGNRDKSLERKGSFFHKSLEVALSAGPVLAINLLPLNNSMDEVTGLPTADADMAEYQSFSPDVAGTNGEKRNKLYASYFQKERFYEPKAEYLLATRDDADSKQILSLTNLSQNKMSFIIKKANIKGYDVTAREWYGNEEIPSFVRPTDLISDYFIEIIAIVGDYGKSKYSQLSVDPTLGEYFTENGLIAEKLEKFLARNEVVVKNRTTGCLIPDFRSKDGQNLFIETMVNNSIISTGIVCAVDREQLDDYEYGTNDSFVDLIGHRLLNNQVSTIQCLSYKQNILNDFVYKQIAENVTEDIKLSQYLKIQYSPTKITVTIESGFEGFENIKQKLQLGQIFKGKTTEQGKTNGITIENPVLKISRLNKLNNSIVFDLTSPYKDSESASNDCFVDFDFDVETPEVAAIGKIAIDFAPGPGGDGSDGQGILKITNKENGEEIFSKTIVGTVDAIRDGLITAINQSNLGFTASKESKSVKVVAPKGYGSAGNKLQLKLTTVGANQNDTTADFAGGVDGVSSLVFEPVSDKFNLDGTNTYFIADKDSEVYKAWKSGILQNGDRIASNDKTQYMQFKLENAINDLDLVNDAREVLKVSLFTDQELQFPIEEGEVILFGSSVNSQGIAISESDKINFASAIESLSSKIAIQSVADNKTIIADIKERDNLKVGQYLVGFDENDEPMLTRILTVKRIVVGESAVPNAISVECDSNIKIYNIVTGEKQVERYLPFTQIAENLEIFSLGGFTLNKAALPDGTNAKMKKIYSVMTDTNIGKALADPELSNFRYIVDTFNGGLEPKSKSYLTELAMKRQKCLALLNAPTVKEFKNSTNPRFTSTPTPENPLPELDINYIIAGGNVADNPDWLYSLPDEEQGASFAGFFFPNIEVTNDDMSISSVPPSAYVSNAFMRKFGTTNEFKPVAGTVRGLITGEGVTGVDYPMMAEEYNELIEFGINPIITKNGSLTIYGNETAYQRFTSTLNNIHARDTLITFEIDTERMLQPYIWDYNDDTLKSTVSTLLRNYYDGMMNSYGAIEDYEVIIDRTNNPSFVVSADAVIVDVAVTITGVAKKFINRITLKGRNVAQSGFTVV